MRHLTAGILTVALLLVAVAYGAGNKPQGDLKTAMDDILLHMQALRPFMVSETKFQDPDNEGKIKDHLTKLSKLVKEVKHEQIMNQPGLRISKRVLEEHLTDTSRIFTVGNKSYARWALNSTFSICMSCHTQAPSASRPWNLVGFSDFGNDFEHAEFLFAARDFDGALAKYDALIDGYPDNKLKNNDLETALERKVAVFARVKRDYKAGLESILKSQKNKKIPEYLRRNLTAWEGLFRKQTKTDAPDPAKATDKDIRAYIEKEMKRGLWDRLIEASNPRLVTNLTVSGVLYEYLNTHPDSKIKPEILYWLALCDRALNNDFFYSLADIYLKECIVQFPKDPVAKKCFKEFELNTVLSYTGSSGENVPEDVRQELRGLKKLVDGNVQ